MKNDKGERVANPETYIHRIGRGGRFGTQAIAVTLWDRDIDKEYLD
jgi:superfamily II DNA/RNA helicase